MHEFGPALQSMARDCQFLAKAPPMHAEGLRRNDCSSLRRADALASVTKVFFPHDVRVHGAREQLDFKHGSVGFGSATLNQIAYGADVDVFIEELQRPSFVLVISLGGTAAVEFDQKTVPLARGDCVLMCPEMRYHFEMAADHHHLAIGIPKDRLAGCGRPYSAVHSVVDPLPDAPNGGAAALLPFLDYICGELQEGAPLFRLQPVVSAVEANLFAMLRGALFDGHHAQLQSTILPAFVRRAERFIAAHLADDISLEDVIQAAGVPARTLYHGFGRFIGHSPMRLLRLRRLERARADIIASDGDLSITQLANRYWMGTGGRFAGLYKESYGESPSTTLARAREEAPLQFLEACDGTRHQLR